MRLFIRSILFLGAIVDVIGAVIIDWNPTLPMTSKLEITGMMLVVAAGALLLEYRIRTSSAFARMASSRLFVVGVWITVPLALIAAYLVIGR
jgi:hypothetical protein